MQDGDYPKSILFIVLYVLGITVVLREIQDNGKIVFWSGGGGTRCIIVYVKYYKYANKLGTFLRKVGKSE